MKSRRQFLQGVLSTTLLARAGVASTAAEDPAVASTVGRFGNYYFGWLPDGPNRALNTFRAPSGLAERVGSADLRPQMPPVYDQGPVGSCVSNAIAAAVQYLRRKAHQPPDFAPSRLYIYYFGRLIEHTVASDSGLSIRDGITAIKANGVCPETLWPYDTTRANKDGTFPSTSLAVLKPRQEAVAEAIKHQAVDAFSISSRGDERILDLEACLDDGYPFVFGFGIYKSFFDSKQLPLPKPPVPPIADTKVGDHAVLAVGYSHANKLFICRNSWGLKDSQGNPVQDGGHFYMPYDYVKNDDLVASFWTVRAVAAVR